MDVVVGARMLDLFAGSGAMGIEALSRGADHVTFVDSSPVAVATVRDNLAATGLADRATVVRADALEFVAATQADFDLVVADPPYAFDDWERLLGALTSEVVVIESDRPVEPGSGRGVQRQRRYGGTVVTVAVQADRADRGRPTPEERT
jgi:16S rRNA (guanine966-N2)-methyltransferase